MYQFTGKLKILAVALMVIGLLGTAWSFMTTPSSLKEAKEIIAKQEAHHGGHSKADTHGEVTTHHEEKAESTEAHGDTNHKEEVTSNSHNDAKHAEEVKDTTHASASTNKEVTKQTHKAEETTHHKVASEDSHASSHNDDHHAEHVFHQMQNRPWSAFYVAMLFFLGVTLLVFAFYVSQRVANAGWSIVLFRVMEAITNNLHYVSGFMLVFIILTVMHKSHLFPWMAEGIFDPLSDNYDPIIDGKKWFMNLPGWAIRSVIYLLGWNIFRFIIRKKSIQQDNGDLKLHKNLYNIGVGFIVFFMISESMMSWDWIMGISSSLVLNIIWLVCFSYFLSVCINCNSYCYDILTFKRSLTIC